jgi:hypothetical protein
VLDLGITGPGTQAFAEVLVELLSTMGPDLGLEMSEGQVKQLEKMMTEENRSLIRV